MTIVQVFEALFVYGTWIIVSIVAAGAVARGRR